MTLYVLLSPSNARALVEDSGLSLLLPHRRLFLADETFRYQRSLKHPSIYTRADPKQIGQMTEDFFCLDDIRRARSPCI
jgi:hypothetical protein